MTIKNRKKNSGTNTFSTKIFLVIKLKTTMVCYKTESVKMTDSQASSSRIRKRVVVIIAECSQQTFVGLQDVFKTSLTRLERNNFTSSKAS